jgi:hypothetical protein
MLFLGISMGLLTAVIDIIDYRRIANRGYPAIDNRKHLRYRTAVISLAIGAVTMLFIGIYENAYIAFSFGLVTAVPFGLNAYYVYGGNLRNDIRTVAALSWTWAGAFIGLLIGLGLATAAEFMEWILYDTTQIVPTYLSSGLVFVLLGGLHGRRVSATSNPNQGIWLSATNALMASAVVGLTMGVVTAVVWQNLFLAFIAGGLAILVTLFINGGGNVVNHFYLRFLLWLTKDLSWDLVSFLEFSVNRVFLHRVGGGYLFTHQTLQAYFAERASA